MKRQRKRGKLIMLCLFVFASSCFSLLLQEGSGPRSSSPGVDYNNTWNLLFLRRRRQACGSEDLNDPLLHHFTLLFPIREERRRHKDFTVKVSALHVKLLWFEGFFSTNWTHNSRQDHRNLPASMSPVGLLKILTFFHLFSFV